MKGKKRKEKWGWKQYTSSFSFLLIKGQSLVYFLEQEFYSTKIVGYMKLQIPLSNLKIKDYDTIEQY